MKQLLFLLLSPCFAMAQYPGNAGQKITLGEQTTADGLVWRGRLADTANLLTNKLDTSVYIVLDTGTRAMWYYRASTTPKWTRLVDSLNNLQGQLSLTSKVTGTLPIANGGTGADMSSLPNNYLIRKNSSGVFDTSAFYEIGGKAGISTTSITTEGLLTIKGTSVELPTSGTISNSLLQIIGSLGNELNIGSNTASGDYGSYIQSSDNNLAANYSLSLQPNGGNVGIGILKPTEILHVFGNARISAMNGINDIGASATGVLQAATSDVNLKNTIENSPFGLNEILLLNPVTFLYNDINRKIDSDVKEVGFIAQDVFDIIPNAVSSTGTGDLQLDYRAITATLVKAIQEQQTLIKALEQRILILENK